jgi:hypothetical protein
MDRLTAHRDDGAGRADGRRQQAGVPAESSTGPISFIPEYFGWLFFGGVTHVLKEPFDVVDQTWRWFIHRKPRFHDRSNC